MTNGEKMISAFPDGEVRKCEKGVVFSTGGWCHAYADEWWNAECKEPTTKNDLGVDCISRDVVKNYIQAHIHEIITESGEDKNKHTNRVLRSMIHGVNCMPSITPQEPCEDAISRQEVLDLIADYDLSMGQVVRGIHALPSVTPQLSVPEVTALAEWTEKLTKASEDAYNKGYADGIKAQAEPKTKIEESNFSREQYVLDTDTAWKCGYEAGKKENSPINICPHCGEYIGEEE